MARAAPDTRVPVGLSGAIFLTHIRYGVEHTLWGGAYAMGWSTKVRHPSVPSISYGLAGTTAGGPGHLWRAVEKVHELWS